MIRVADVAPASGKTYTIAHKSIEHLAEGKSTLILAPTHKAGEEAMSMMPAPAGSAFVVQLLGKRVETCLPEHEKKQCTKCPIFKKIFEEESSLNAEILEKARGKKLDKKGLWQIAHELGLCPVMIGRVLAMAEVPRVVVAAHAFLGSEPGIDLLEKVTVDRIYVDEADQLMDVLLQSAQRRLTLMEARLSNLNTVYGACSGNCKECVPTFADTRSNKLSPFQSRLQDKTEATSPSLTIENIRASFMAVNTAIKAGIIKGDIFDDTALSEFVTALDAVLPKYQPGTSTTDYLTAVANHSAETRIELSNDTEFAIPLPVRPVLLDKGTRLEDVGDFEGHQDIRLKVLRKRIFVDQGVSSKTINSMEPNLSVFLQVVDFLSAADGTAYLFPEKADPSANDQGPEHCRLTLRCLKRSQYQRVVKFLDGALLVSGTFFDAKMTAAHFLCREEDISFTDASCLFPKNVLVVVHNPKPKAKLPIHPIEQHDAVTLFSEVQSKIENIHILNFAVNTAVADETFREISRNDELTQHFAVQNTKNVGFEVDHGASEEGRRERPATITIDKLRSASSRAVNRDFFQLCIVIGNGISNWNDRVMLFLEARKNFPELTLGDLIQYEQKRAVIQALLRAPRSGKLTVCLYAGNLHRLAFPGFLWNRIITTEALIREYEHDLGGEVTKGLKSQIDAIAHGIVKFLTGGEPMVLPLPAETPEPPTAGDQKIEHVKKCIEEKGYVDKIADKRGERPAWQAFLNELTEGGILKEEKKGRKSVFVKGNHWDNPNVSV